MTGYSTLFATGLFLSYTGSATLPAAHPPRVRRPKLALRTHLHAMPSGPLSAVSPTSSVPPSPRVPRRRSSLTMAHNPIAAIKSPTRAAGISSRAHALIQSLNSPVTRTWTLEAVGERSFEQENTPRCVGGTCVAQLIPHRRRIGAPKPPPTVPLPAVPTLTLITTLPSPLSPALEPSPNVLPAPTPDKPTRSPLVTRNDPMDPMDTDSH
ncbi:hypothetical protein CTheo_8273 [Ceratobasidium theobromae]|uniref:Transmembrane protein n=1 Tax=Ceratobasidium theobromae TaxID=1582974 RepID=A0A5N5QA20_9AGAM|nr:hypothetical protein CTheo_8273 [Ceratobasidium theobromae]